MPDNIRPRVLSTHVIIAIVLSSTILPVGMILTTLGLIAKRKQSTLKVSISEPVQNSPKAVYVNVIVHVIANTDNMYTSMYSRLESEVSHQPKRTFHCIPTEVCTTVVVTFLLWFALACGSTVG